MDHEFAHAIALMLVHESTDYIAQAIHEADPAIYWQEFVEALQLEQEQIYVGKDLYLNRYFLAPNYKTKDSNRRVLLHEFIRGDYDRRPHNHPWDWAESVILSGGYIEDRIRGFEATEILLYHPEYRKGDINNLSGMDFHRVHSVQPNTWTVFRHGRHVKKWGFIDSPPLMTMFEDYDGPAT